MSKSTAGHVERSFDYPTEKKINKRPIKTCSLYENDTKKTSGKFFPKKPIWTGKMRFWQPSRKFLPGRTEISAQSPKKMDRKELE